MSFETINHLHLQITLVTPTPYVFLPKGDGILDRSIRDLQEEFVSYSRYSNRSNNSIVGVAFTVKGFKCHAVMVFLV